MLKATSGGGGRGIRRCDDPQALRQNYVRVISEATKAFGRAEVFLERCVVNPRHIEVQVLADHHGNCVHLFERDCSIQREAVTAGQAVLVTEAMKMESEIQAPIAGTVTGIFVAKGDSVNPNEVLIEIEPANGG
jgi:acetyl/propionyl-CoA carboxylase alpha subunit